MITPQLDVIGVVAADMAASLAFYRDLGLDIPADADTQPHVEVTLPGGLRLAWDTVDTVRTIDPDYVEPSGSPRMGLAFKVDTPSDVDATYQRLVDAAGYHGHKRPWDAFWGQRYAVIHDPDGNSVDLFAALPPAGGTS
jgi:catechol 2,3-dioxygenase-like lactoylglutathione lyase family enzyme